MKKNSRSKIGALVMAGSIVLFAACNNSDYTKNSSSGANADTTTSTGDTSATAGASQNKMMAAKKKGRVGVGTMAKSSTANMKPDKDGVYEMTEVQPSYPGGQSALESYINDNLQFPQTAIDDNKEGTVNVQFVVDENGKVTTAKAIGTELGSGLDEEASRVIANMPKWEPGKVKGKAVKTRLVLPITYKIEE